MADTVTCDGCHESIDKSNARSLKRWMKLTYSTTVEKTRWYDYPVGPLKYTEHEIRTADLCSPACLVDFGIELEMADTNRLPSATVSDLRRDRDEWIKRALAGREQADAALEKLDTAIDQLGEKIRGTNVGDQLKQVSANQPDGAPTQRLIAPPRPAPDLEIVRTEVDLAKTIRLGNIPAAIARIMRGE